MNIGIFNTLKTDIKNVFSYLEQGSESSSFITRGFSYISRLLNTKNHVSQNDFLGSAARVAMIGIIVLGLLQIAQTNLSVSGFLRMTSGLVLTAVGYEGFIVARNYSFQTKRSSTLDSVLATLSTSNAKVDFLNGLIKGTITQLVTQEILH